MSDPAKALLRWLSAHDPVAHLVLACADVPLPRVPRRAVVVQVACLADCDAGLAAQLLANGVGSVLTLPCDRASQAVAAWGEVLTDVVPFTPPRRGQRAKDVLVLGQVPLPRRALLGLPSDSVLDLRADPAARTLAAFRILQEAGRARFPGETGPRTEAAPAVMQPLGDAPEPVLGPTSAAAELLVSGCIACGVCVRACPHDALVLEHEGATSTLTHLAESCRSELQCVALCPVDAFSVPGSLSLAAVLEEPVRHLAAVATAACERCGARHPAAEGRLCAACRFREDNAFGAALPPGVAEKLPPEVVEKLAALRRQDPGHSSGGDERD